MTNPGEPRPPMSVGRDGVMRPARRFDTTAKDVQIIELRKAGMTLSRIAQAVGFSVSTAGRVIQLNGAQGPNRRRFDTSARDAQIVELPQAGMTLSRIAQAVGCSIGTAGA